MGRGAAPVFGEHRVRQPDGRSLDCRMAKRPTTRDFVAVAEFRNALRRFQRRSENIARQAGLTPQRYVLLLMIKGAPDGSEQSTVTDLAQRLQLAQSTVTELVGRAEDAGLLEREHSQRDARVFHLRLTTEGDRRLALAFTELETERAQLREAFASADQELP